VGGRIPENEERQYQTVYKGSPLRSSETRLRPCSAMVVLPLQQNHGIRMSRTESPFDSPVHVVVFLPEALLEFTIGYAGRLSGSDNSTDTFKSIMKLIFYTR
jgi:hypothetical protein